MSNRILRILKLTLLITMMYNSQYCSSDSPPEEFDECFCETRVKYINYPGPDLGDPTQAYFVADCEADYTFHPNQEVWGYEMTANPSGLGSLSSDYTKSYYYVLTKYATVRDFCIATCLNPKVMASSLFRRFLPPQISANTLERNSYPNIYEENQTPSLENALLMGTMADNYNFHEGRARDPNAVNFVYRLSIYDGPTFVTNTNVTINTGSYCKTLQEEHRYRVLLPESHRHSYRGVGGEFRRTDDIDENCRDEDKHVICNISQVPDCHVLECVRKVYLAQNRPMCRDSVLSTIDINNSSAVSAYCDDYKPENLELGFNICDTTENCQAAGCNLTISCESSVPANTPVCGNNYQLYNTASEYCAAKSAGSVTSFFTCNGTCTQSYCTQKQCQDTFTDYTNLSNSVCKADGSFYNDVYSFCNIVGHSRSNAVLCGANQNQICTQSECCEKECNTHGSTTGCNADNQLESYSSYCHNKCANSTYGISLCYQNGVAVNCTTCGNSCVANLDALYATPNTVCGNNDVFYSSKQEFCTAKETNATLDVQLCSGNMSCADDHNCCVQNCVAKNPNYQGGCYQGHYDFINNVQDYCNYYCTNNRTIQLISANQNECCVDKCINTENRHDACNPTNYLLTSVADQCSSKCSNTQINYLTCGSEDCDQNDCNVKECVASDPNDPNDYLGVCGSNSILYADKTAYCEAHLQNSSIQYVAFPIDVTRTTDNCKIQACIYNNKDNYYTRCDIEYNFFTTVRSYCIATVSNETVILLMCEDNNNPGHQIPCNQVQCNVQLCIDNFKPLCSNGPDYLLTTDALNYCQNFINNHTYADNFTSCPAGCNDNDCFMKKCLETNIEKAYCGDNGEFYGNKQDFCNSKLLDSSLNEAICDNRLDCNSPETCQVNHCVSQLGSTYASICDTNYTPYITDIDYCEAQNANPNFTILTCTDESNQEHPCTLSECCELKCNSTFEPLCDANFDLVENAEDYCSTYCADNSYENTVHKCENGGCAQSDCDKKECLQNNANHSYCTNTGVFYFDHNEFCDAKLADNTIFELLCNNTNCSDQDECDIAYCIYEESDNWYARCDNSFNLYQNPREYCQAKHSSLGIIDLLCGQEPCNANQCCQQECASDEYIKVCGPAPDFIFYDSEIEYCETLCQTTDFASSVNDCVGDCTQIDCDQKKCVYDQSRNTICGNDSVYYLSKDAFCHEKVQNNISEVLCEDGQCDSEFECCLAVCHEDNPEESYVPRCNTEYEFLETRDEYCLRYCDKSKDYEDLMCGSSFCSKTQCCTQDCNQNTEDYLPVCNSSYVPLSLNLYCDSYCQNPEFTRYSCPGGCDAAKCETLECNNMLKSVNGPICLFEPYANKYFYNDKASYCETKIARSDFNYSIGDRLGCSGAGCVDEETCCISRCLDEGLFTGCDGVNFKPVTPSNYCYARCRNPSQNAPLVKCHNDNGAVTNCNERTCCMKQLKANNVSEPLCASSGTVFLTHASYCNHKSNVDTGISLLVAEDIDFAICGSDFNLYSSLYSFCTAKSQNTALVNVGICQGSACNSTLCCNRKCDSSIVQPVIIDNGNKGFTAYQNMCYATCAVANPVISMSCALGVATETCRVQYCLQSKCASAKEKYICANDNSIYRNSCEAECRGLTKKFNCSPQAKPGNWQFYLCDLNCSSA